MRFKSALLCGAAVAAVAQAAPARADIGANPVYGAGSTLVDNVYRALFNCVGENGPHMGGPGILGAGTCAPGSETAPVSGIGIMEILYAGIGTGSGQNDYLTNTAVFGATPSNTGFYQDTAAGYTYRYSALHFGAGSTPLTADQLAQTSISGHAVVVGTGNITGPAIQVPTLVTAVAVPIHAATLDGLAGLPIPTDGQGKAGSSGLVLSTEQLCGIFNGDIADWNDPALTQSNGLTPSSTSKPIRVVYRDDSAGTTFLISNALITQCAGTAHPMDPAWGSASFTYFLNASPKPASWVDEDALTSPPENGDEGVADAVSATDGAIAYSSLEFAAPFGVPGHTPSPTANLVNKSGTIVPPTPYSASLIMASVAAPTSADDAATWGTKGFNPNPLGRLAYPIGGFSWVYLYTCYQHTQDFIDIASGAQPGVWGWYFSSFAQADVTAILNNHGFGRIPNAWLRAIRNLLFTDPATKIRVGPSAGVCTGGA